MEKYKPELIPLDEIFQEKQCLKPEALFYNEVITLLTNLVINNPNYFNGSMSGDSFYKQFTTAIEKTKDVIEVMSERKHLINL